MLSYTTPARIAAANKEADRIMAGKPKPHAPDAKRKGPSGETPEDVRRRAGDKVAR